MRLEGRARQSSARRSLATERRAADWRALPSRERRSFSCEFWRLLPPVGAGSSNNPAVAGQDAYATLGSQRKELTSDAMLAWHTLLLA